MKVFLAIATLAAPAIAHTESPLPSWEPDDYKRMLRGDWPAGEILPDDSPQKLPPAPASTIPTSGSDSSTVTPENPDSVPKLLQTEFLRLGSCGSHVIDPQGLLSEQETDDLQAILEAINEDSNIHVQVSLYLPSQDIRIDLNAPAFALQIFKDKTRHALLEYRIGRPDLSQLVFSKDIEDLITDSQRRRILDNCKLAAQSHTAEPDSLLQLVGQLGLSAREISGKLNQLERDPRSKNSAAPSLPDIKLDYAIRPAPQKEPGMFARICASAEPLIPSFAYSAAGLFAGILLVLSIRFWRINTKVKLPATRPDKRLGANNGALVSKSIQFRNSTFTSPGGHGFSILSK